MDWTPLPLGQVRLIDAGEDGVALDIGSVRFKATWNADALGALCFAYGLDNQLFGLKTVEASGFLWVAWHFCALISKQREPAALRGMAVRGLDAALELVDDAAVYRDIGDRFEARYELVLHAARRRRSDEGGGGR